MATEAIGGVRVRRFFRGREGAQKRFVAAVITPAAVFMAVSAPYRTTDSAA